MADYISKCRTNYFSVTDEARLREIVSKCRGENPCLLIQNKEDKSKFSFRCSCNFSGLFELIDENIEDCKTCKSRSCEDCELMDLDEVSAIDKFFEELQKILPAGEAIIFTEIGSEEMRYLSGVSTIITKGDCKQLDLDELSVKAARNMLCNPKFETKMNY